MTPLAWVASDFDLAAVVRQRLQTPGQDGAAGPGPWQLLPVLSLLQRPTRKRTAQGPMPTGAQVCVLQTPLPVAERLNAASTLGSLRDRFGASVWILVLLAPTQAQSGADAQVWLDAGADRVLPLDADPALVAASLRALIRRAQGVSASQTALGALRFDHPSATLFWHEQRVLLTARETQLAALFFERGLQVVRTQEIVHRLGLRKREAAARAAVPLYVHRLNGKIRPCGLQLVCLRGLGYRLQPMASDVLAHPGANARGPVDPAPLAAAPVPVWAWPAGPGASWPQRPGPG